MGSSVRQASLLPSGFTRSDDPAHTAEQGGSQPEPTRQDAVVPATSAGTSLTRTRIAAFSIGAIFGGAGLVAAGAVGMHIHMHQNKLPLPGLPPMGQPPLQRRIPLTPHDILPPGENVLSPTALANLLNPAVGPLQRDGRPLTRSPAVQAQLFAKAGPRGADVMVQDGVPAQAWFAILANERPAFVRAMFKQNGAAANSSSIADVQLFLQDHSGALVPQQVGATDAITDAVSGAVADDPSREGVPISWPAIALNALAKLEQVDPQAQQAAVQSAYVFSAITGQKPWFIVLDAAQEAALSAQISDPKLISTWMAPDAATVEHLLPPVYDKGILLSTGWKLYLPGFQPFTSPQVDIRSLIPFLPQPAAWLLQSPKKPDGTADVFILDPDNVMQVGTSALSQNATDPSFELYLPSAYVFIDLPITSEDPALAARASAPPPPAADALGGNEPTPPFGGRLAQQVQLMQQELTAVVQTPKLSAADLIQLGGTLMTGLLPETHSVSPTGRRLRSDDADSTALQTSIISDVKHSEKGIWYPSFRGTRDDEVVVLSEGINYADTGKGHDTIFIPDNSYVVIPGTTDSLHDTILSAEAIDHVVIDVRQRKALREHGSTVLSTTVHILLVRESADHSSTLQKHYVNVAKRHPVAKHFWSDKDNWGIRSGLRFTVNHSGPQLDAINELCGWQDKHTDRQIIIDDIDKIKQFVPGLGYDEDFAERILGRPNDGDGFLQFDRPDDGILEFRQRLADDVQPSSPGWATYAALAAGGSAALMAVYVGANQLKQALAAGKEALGAGYTKVRSSVDSLHTEMANLRIGSELAPETASVPVDTL